MIRLAWRQIRVAAAAGGALVLAIAVVAVATRPHLVDLYDTLVRKCAARGDCDTTIPAFLRTDETLRTWLGILVIVVPGIAGVFWGAPLVARELETGTFRLAWTQSVTPTRWLATKLALVGAVTALVAGLCSLVVTWWAQPLDRAGMDRFATFDQRHLVPVGHALFAFALGIAAGVVLRRTLPAMATTLVVFTTVRVTWALLLRPHLRTPLRLTYALDAGRTGFGSIDGGPFTLQSEPPAMPNAWVHSTSIVDAAGRSMPSNYVSTSCPGLPQFGPRPGESGVRAVPPDEIKSGIGRCISKAAETYHGLATYQPAGRYWSFQWIETGLYVGLAAALAGLAFVWVRRRLT